MFQTSDIMRKSLFLSLLVLLSVCLSAGSAQAQFNTDYLRGVQLMQQNRYEEAYDIFYLMLRRDPSNYPVFDQTLNALTQLKRYDEAIELTRRRLGRNDADIVLATRLGELYHLNAQTEEAFAIWTRTVRANENSLQAYRYVAETMTNRREFSHAITLYETARNRFANQTLFFAEITSAWMALGNFEKGVETLLGVLSTAPGNSTFVQRQLINYDDPRITEAAIVQLQENSQRVPPSDPAYGAYREVMISLLMEQRLFRRALSTARSYESDAREGIWPVYALANRLRSQKQFALADEAYGYYAERSDHPLQARSMEDRAVLYITWSRELTAQNLDYDEKASTLYSQADEILRQLIARHPNYNRLNEVLTLKSEIALDYLKNTPLAEEYLAEINRRPANPTHQITSDYLQGRIYMSKGQHSLARINLTRANREARTGDLAEKSRYFLALNDFYNGDFEFAAIQMRPLERLSTSFYANDALRLRLWMQEGYTEEQASEELQWFAKARYLFDSGQSSEAISVITPLVTANFDRPLRGEAVLMTANYLRTINPSVTVDLLSKIVDSGFTGAQRERLLWERVRITDGIMHAQQPPVSTTIPNEMAAIMEWTQSTRETRSQIPSDFDAVAHVSRLYEDLLFEFPMGYYADAVRTRLRELQSRNPL